MKIRLSTLNTPLFDHEGLQLNEHWSEVETNELEPAGRAAIVKYAGRILQVHPADADKLKSLSDELGPKKSPQAVTARKERA